ncbi:MAG TPA: ABC transporter ATP-binding protein [candidate division Zixibacteria bacterium]|nr:ABC transporter ATP-binding protein [candidate division Zixibacteria bacterium]
MLNADTPMIEFGEVSKQFAKTLAVDSLNLTIPKGEFFGFLGPNGAGKTTTIKMITGLAKPTNGKVLINGIDVQEEPERAKSIIGYIPDSPYIYDKLTGREFLNLVGGLYNMPKEHVESRIEWLFELFGVDGWGDDFAGEYSHGMRQKIVMASALLHDPELIVIDEPMVGLDPQAQRLAKDILLKLVERGKTIFMSTHTLSVAAELCSRIGLISHGKLIEKLGGTSAESLERRILEITGGERTVFFPDE